MHRPDVDAYAFLAPGLLHQFGNLLLTIQGSALTMEVSNLPHSRQVILGANDRASVTLRVMRVLLGEPATYPVPAGTLLEQLAELLRVPVRERGQGLEVRPPSPAEAPIELRVEFGAFVWIVVEGARQLLEAVPEGVVGALCLSLHRTSAAGKPDSGALLSCRFQAVAGTLPFPLPTATAAEQLSRRLVDLRIAGHCKPHANGFDLRLGEQLAVRRQEA